VLDQKLKTDEEKCITRKGSFVSFVKQRERERERESRAWMCVGQIRVNRERASGQNKGVSIVGRSSG
jgi:hypothetical protein